MLPQERKKKESEIIKAHLGADKECYAESVSERKSGFFGIPCIVIVIYVHNTVHNICMYYIIHICII